MDKAPLFGPFRRDQRAQFDEIKWLFEAVNDESNPQTLIDVGAHLGNVFKSFAEADWEVHAIEPYPPHFEALSLRCDNQVNVHLHKVAIGDSNGTTLPFYASYESSGINSLSPFRSSHRKVAEVAVTTLAHLVESQSINRVDFLKIDTEGYDLMALKGFPWRKFLPRIVVCEFEDAKTMPVGYKMEEMAMLLETHGYRVLVSEWHPIDRYGIPHDWHALRKFPATLETEKTWGNLIAIRDSSDLSLLIETAASHCSFYDDVLVAKSIHGANPELDGKVLGALLEGMQIVIFGAGGSGQIALHSIRNIECEVLCFADNDPNKHGSKLHGLPVVSAQELSTMPLDLILIASDFAQDIYRDLISIGLPDEKIRIFHVCIGFEP